MAQTATERLRIIRDRENALITYRALRRHDEACLRRSACLSRENHARRGEGVVTRERIAEIESQVSELNATLAILRRRSNA